MEEAVTGNVTPLNRTLPNRTTQHYQAQHHQTQHYQTAHAPHYLAAHIRSHDSSPSSRMSSGESYGYWATERAKATKVKKHSKSKEKSKRRIIVTSLLENLAVRDEGTRSSRSHRNLIARLHGHLGIIVTSLDEGTRSSRYHRNLIAKLYGHQGVIVTSLLENLAVWMRLHGHQGCSRVSGLRYKRLHGHRVFEGLRVAIQKV